jgi:hypothetical protein
LKKITRAAMVAASALSVLAVAGPASAYDGNGSVPGQLGREGAVTGHYLTTQYGCDYIVNYRGDFVGDAYLNDGWIFNKYVCEDGTQGTYLIVYKTEPRWTGNPDRAIWGEWEIVVDTQEGVGNVANPQAPQYTY